MKIQKYIFIAIFLAILAFVAFILTHDFVPGIILSLSLLAGVIFQFTKISSDKIRRILGTTIPFIIFIYSLNGFGFAPIFAFALILPIWCIFQLFFYLTMLLVWYLRWGQKLKLSISSIFVEIFLSYLLTFTIMLLALLSLDFFKK